MFDPSVAAEPVHRPVAEPFGMFGGPFFQVVGHKRGDRRRAPGEEPQQESDRGGAKHCPDAIFDIGPGRHPALDLHLADGGEPLFNVDHHLADGKKTYDDGDEIDADRQRDGSEGQPLRPGERVLTDEAGREPQGHRDNPLQEGTARKANHQTQSHEHQCEILRRTEEHGKLGERRGEKG